MKRNGINATFIGEEQEDQQVISTIIHVSKFWTERIIVVAFDEAHS